MAATATTLNFSPDGQALEAWLKGLPADPRAAFAALRERIQALSSAGSIAAQERFVQLECMRRRAAELMPEQRSCYVGKAIPLDNGESQAWQDLLLLWEALCIALLCQILRRASVTPRWSGSAPWIVLGVREHSYSYQAILARCEEFNTVIAQPRAAR
jgi:hypothetical protein